MNNLIMAMEQFRGKYLAKQSNKNTLRNPDVLHADCVYTVSKLRSQDKIALDKRLL